MVLLLPVIRKSALSESLWENFARVILQTMPKERAAQRLVSKFVTWRPRLLMQLRRGRQREVDVVDGGRLRHGGRRAGLSAVEAGRRAGGAAFLAAMAGDFCRSAPPQRRIPPDDTKKGDGGRRRTGPRSWQRSQPRPLSARGLFWGRWTMVVVSRAHEARSATAR